MQSGVVYLIGAGPGDPDLLTLAAHRVLLEADAILYDGLVNESLLRGVKPECVLQCVGKRGHGGQWRQSQIDDLLVDYARRFSRVVRLKGGDTTIFARTAEEVERLEAEGIEYRILPGLTVALAASAYTGIPVTHRDWSSSVAFVSGQLQPSDGSSDSEEPIDWDALARFPGTLVLYMGLSSAGQWSSQLVAAGKSPATPVALIRRCTWPDQQVLRCELATVAETLAAHPEFRAPAISIIGEVVQAEPLRCWFTSQPLFGQTFVLTNPAQPSHKLESLVREYGGNCVLAPAMRIEPPADWGSTDAAIAALHATDWVVFSSVYGVTYFMDRVFELGYDARRFGNASLAAVGAATADALRSYGLRCDVVPRTGAGAEALGSELVPKAAGSRVTLVRSPDGRRWLEEQLAGCAKSVLVAEAYRQSPVSEWSAELSEALLGRNDVWFVATSSNVAQHAFHLLGADGSKVRWLSLSPAVSQVLRELGGEHIVTSSRADYASMVQSAIAALKPFETPASLG